METSEVLNLAADLIEKRGWTRGSGWQLTDLDTESALLCLEGAIQVASGMPKVAGRTASELSVRINLCPAGAAVHSYLEVDGALFSWNDARRDQAEVIEVLRACALLEEAKESAAVELVTA